MNLRLHCARHGLRFALRAPQVLVWLLLGLAAVAGVFPLIPSRATRARVQTALTRHWSRALLALCGVTVRVAGHPVKHGAVLTVANHVSWIDIFVLNSVRTTAFIAKSEVRRWPLVGWLVAGAGTIFIARGLRHSDRHRDRHSNGHSNRHASQHTARSVSEQMARCFDQGRAVGLFPEGTTSVGDTVLPFRASLFAPARDAEVAVQPVALTFFQHGSRSATAAFVGDETLVANLWRVLGTTGLAVTATYLPVLPPVATHSGTRQTLAQNARERVVAVVSAQS